MLRIALAMLVNDTGKYIGIVLGLTFTSFMMSLQPASFLGALGSMMRLVDDIPIADLWVMEPSVLSLNDYKPLADQKLYRIKGITSVAWAVPLHKGSVRVRLADGSYQNCSLYGLDDTSLIGGPSDMAAGTLADLRQSDSILVDLVNAGPSGRFAQGHAGQSSPLRIGDSLEINERRAKIVGFHRSVSAEQLPVLYTTYSRVKQYVADRKILTYVLVKLKPGAHAAQVAADIRHFTGFAAYSAAQFKSKSFDYFLWSTGSFISFGIVTLITLGIGASIAAQSFLSFSHENLRYFGVFKAMGASTLQLVSMILAQALLVASIGFGIGVGTMVLLGRFLREGVGLDFELAITPGLLLFSGGCVHLVCLCAALFSIRRVLRLEPADVFRN